MDGLSMSLDDIIAARKQAGGGAARGRERGGDRGAAGGVRRGRVGKGGANNESRRGVGGRGGGGGGDRARGPPRQPRARRELLPRFDELVDGGGVRVLFDGAPVAVVTAAGSVTLSTAGVPAPSNRSGALRSAVTAALRPLGVAIEGGTAPTDWTVTCGGTATPFVDGLTVDPAAVPAAGRAAAVLEHLQAGVRAKAAGG
jgi:hypothetical protein